MALIQKHGRKGKGERRESEEKVREEETERKVRLCRHMPRKGHVRIRGGGEPGREMSKEADLARTVTSEQ